MIDRRAFAHFDWLTFFVSMGLCLIGLASVYSAVHTRWPSIHHREIYWIIIGSSLLFAAFIINYSVLERFGYVLYGSSLVLLVMVFAVGRSAAGAKRWINLGLFTVQPSEFAKLALIVALAKYFSSKTATQEGLSLKDLAIPGLIMVMPFALVVKQPDLGTAIILGMIFLSMALAVKIRWRVLAGLAVAGLAMTPFVWKALKGYQKARLTSFLDPRLDPKGTGYHIMQSKIAIGSGGIMGKGYLHGTQGKLMFLPEHHTDFIFAALAEEWGALGSLIVISLFAVLILNGLNTAGTSKDRFGFLLAFGLTSMLFWHAAINLGMVSGLLPVVGVPLPFISYGGSFLVTSMTAAGLLINVRMRRFMF